MEVINHEQNESPNEVTYEQTEDEVSKQEESDVVKKKGDPEKDVQKQETNVSTSEELETQAKEVETNVIQPLNDTTDTSITQKSTKFEHYTDEGMVHEVELSISGNVTILENHVIKLEMPGEHVEKLEIGSLDKISRVEYATEEDKRVAYVYFHPLSGGTVLSFTVRTKFKEQTTPEGYELPIDAAFLSADGNVVAEAEPVSFKSKYNKTSFDKYLNGKRDNGQVIYAGKSDGTKISENADDLVAVPFSFSTLSNMFGGKYRKMAKATIIDTLPPYAEFNPELNPNWTYNADDKTVTRVFEGPYSSNSSLVEAIQAEKLWLIFPGAELLKTYTNSAQVIFEPENMAEYEKPTVYEDDINYQLDDKITTGFFGKNAVTSQIIDSVSGKTQPQSWTITIENPSSMEMRDIVIEDTIADAFGSSNDRGLDERMVYERLSVRSSYFKESTLQVIAIVGDAAEEVLVEKDGDDYVFPEDTKGFRINIDKLAPEATLQYIYLYTKLKNPDEVHYDGETTANNIFKNTATVKTDFVPPNKPDERISVEGTDSDSMPLVQLNEQVGISKSIQSPQPTYVAGDVIKFDLQYNPSRTVDPNRILPNAKFIDLLPDGLTPIPSSKYEIVENFQNSGRTAIVYELGDIKASSRNYVSVSATVNKYSHEGLNKNEVYFIYDGEQLPINKGSAPDRYDLNNNGDTTEILNYASVDYNFVQDKEVTSTKYIKNKDQNNWSITGISMEEEAEFDYRLHVKNLNENEVNNLIVYDVLPYKDDKAIVKNEAGERVPRESIFSNTLAGPVIGAEGFTIYYSTGSIIEDERDAINNGNWQETVSDYSQVTAIKIVMNEGTVLASNEEVNFYVPMKAPKKWALAYGDKAYNSFAISTNNGQTFVETNKVFNEITAPARITKDVEGEEHLNVNRESEYKYNVYTQIPEDIEDYETFTITDSLDSGLTVNADGVEATVDGEAYDGLTVSVEGNKVTVTVKQDGFAGLAGKKQIELVIPAKINEDTDLSKYEDHKIPNTATLDYKHRDGEASSKDTEPVTVTPQDPGITKDVNGEIHLDINRGEEYIYNVIAFLPENIKDYKKFIIVDEVDSGLTVNADGVTALVDGELYHGLKVTVEGNKVTVEVTNIAGLEGKKQIELVIPAEINENTDISQYVDHKIPNTATLDFTNANDEEKSKETDPVTVTPSTPSTPPEGGGEEPTEEPKISKNVEGKEHLNIAREAEYNYNVVTELPEDIKGYETFIIMDTVDSGLTVNADGVKATVDGEAYDGLTVSVDGNKVTVTVTDFAGLEGKKQIELVIPAKINQDTDISKYKDNKIPNTATLDFKHQNSEAGTKETEPVTVTPNDEPKIMKDVNGRDHLNIGREREYKYNIITQLPKDIQEYKELTITDEVDKGLTVIAGKVIATVDGQAYEGLEVTVEGNKVTVTVKQDSFAGLEGKKQIELVIPAKINKDTNMSKYVDNKIPNSATLEFTNADDEKKSKVTDPVTVTPSSSSGGGGGGGGGTPPTDPNKPGEEPKEPGENPNEPGEEPKEPGEDPNEPGEEPKEPGEDPNEPGEEPKEPGKNPGEPGEEPKEPGKNPSESKDSNNQGKDSTTPNGPENSSHSNGLKGNHSKDTGNHAGNKLPNTSTSIYNVGLLGLLLLTIGLLSIRRKRTAK